MNYYKKGNTSLIVIFVIVILLVVFAIYLLLNKSNTVNPIEEINQKTMPASVGEITTNNNKEVEIINKLENKNMEKVSKNGDVLVMNYTGRLTNGVVFDSNVDPKFGHVEPFKFTLGSGQVIKGWDEGLVGMKIGEKKTLNIPPEKGYGSMSIGKIPANSTLIFDVELVGIE